MDTAVCLRFLVIFRNALKFAVENFTIRKPQTDHLKVLDVLPLRTMKTQGKKICVFEIGKRR